LTSSFHYCDNHILQTRGSFHFTQQNYLDEVDFIFSQNRGDWGEPVNLASGSTVEAAFNTDVNHLRDPLVDFSPFHTSVSQHQPTSSQCFATSGTGHSIVYQSHPSVISHPSSIQPTDVFQLEDGIDNFNFRFDSPLGAITPPPVTVQQSSPELSDSVVPSHLFSLSGPESEPLLGQNLREGIRNSSADSSLGASLPDGIQCTWPSCNKAFPSIHVYKYVVLSKHLLLR